MWRRIDPHRGSVTNLSDANSHGSGDRHRESRRIRNISCLRHSTASCNHLKRSRSTANLNVSAGSCMSRDRQDLESELQLWLVLKVWHDGQITRSSSADFMRAVRR